MTWPAEVFAPGPSRSFPLVGEPCGEEVNVPVVMNLRPLKSGRWKEQTKLHFYANNIAAG